MENEVDFTELPNEIFKNALDDIVKELLGDKEYKIECSAGSKKGDNALGVIYRIKIKSNDNDFKKSLILKTSPQNQTRRDEFLTHEIFERETKFYQEVFPMYQKFQEERRYRGFYHVPNCFKSLNDAPLEGQFFEDLSEEFVMHNKYVDLSKDHVLLVMKTLAKLHGTYFAIKDQRPKLVEKYRQMPDLITKIFKIEKSANLAWLKQQIEEAMVGLKNCKNQELIDKVHAVLKVDIVKQFEEVLSGDNAEPYAVLCHGDCWNNNMLFKLNENQHPVDLRFLDFQFMRYASVATDIGYYIFGCTTKELRDEHFQDFMDTYYNTLDEHLRILGSDPEYMFPRHAFEDQMKKFAKYGMLMGVLLVANYVSEDFPEMDEMTMKFKEQSNPKKEIDAPTRSFISDKTTKKYENRMMDVFTDMYNLGFI